MDSHYLILTRTLPCKQVIICQLLHGYKTSIYVSLLFHRKGLTCLPKLLFIFPKTEITTNDIGNEKGDYAFIYLYISNMYTILLYSRVHSVAQIFYLQVIISILI